VRFAARSLVLEQRPEGLVKTLSLVREGKATTVCHVECATVLGTGKASGVG
jgi:hypothetical protein